MSINYTVDQTGVTGPNITPGLDDEFRVTAERLKVHENLQKEWPRLTKAEQKERLLQMRLDDASNSDSIELRREKSILADQKHERRLQFLRERQQLGQSAEEAMAEYEKMLQEAANIN